MALTKISTNGVKDQNVDLTKLPHGDANNDGKFLRANNGADPSFESVPAGGISNVVEDTSPQLGGNLDTNSYEISLDTSHAVNFGDSNELTVKYHGGHGQIIYTGNNSLQLKVKANSYFQVIDNDTGNNIIQAQAGGKLLICHAGTQVVETSANGLAFPSGKGIDFSATSGTGTSELFEDYEEGTFTPEFNAGSAASACYDSGVSYSSQVGVYRKVGHVVYFIIKIQVSSGTLKSGILQINNLPFTTGDFSSYSTAGGAQYGYSTGYFSGSGNRPTIYVSPGNSILQFFTTAGNNFNGTSLNQAAGRMDIFGHYFTS